MTGCAMVPSAGIGWILPPAARLRRTPEQL